jgi:gliding motility-associated-like protein
MPFKNNTKSIIFLFLLLISIFKSNAQDFRWARQIKGINYDYSDFANGLAVDNDENSYVIGRTESPLFDLDPTVSGTEIINNSNVQNFAGIYLIKLDKDGKYLWGKTFGNYKRGDDAFNIKIGTDGNIYALFTIQEHNTALNVIDSFIQIIKISPNGGVIYTYKIKQNYGYNNNIYVSSFDLDNQNNLFLTGYFVGNITLDTNNPALNLNANGIDNYLLKINNNGNFDWVKQFNITDNLNGKVIVRNDGNINLQLNRNNGYELYNINNIDNSIIWKKYFNNQSFVNFYVTDNNIILTGKKSDVYQTSDIDPSSVVNNVDSENFIIFLDLNGEFVDVKKYAKPVNGDFNFTSITSDINGNLFFSGYFKDTADFDPSNNTYNLTSAGYGGEAFYLKLDKNRNFESAMKFGDENPKVSAYNNCYSFKIKDTQIKNGNNYLIGDFMWICDFDPSTTNNYTLNTINGATINSDGFVLKLGPCDNNKPIGDTDQYFCSNQNPKIENLIPNSSNIIWYDSATSTIPIVKLNNLIDNKVYFAAKKEEGCPESTERLVVTAHITQSPTPPNALNQEFCEKIKATLSNISIVGTNIKWYDSLNSTTELPNLTLLQNNITYYATQTINGCESNKTPITITIKPNPTPTTTSPQTFCIQQNATLNDIAITGQNIKWYDALTNGNLLPNTATVQNGTTYYASQTINGCESERVAVLVNIQNTSLPTADTNQSFCTGTNPTIENIQVTGSSIKWYDALNNGSLLSETTNLIDGVTYYASQTVNNCESERLGIQVSIVNTPLAPTANKTQSFCKNENATLSDIQISGQNIRWYKTNFAVATLPNTTLLENNKTYYASQTIGCESDRTPILIRVYDTPLPIANKNQQFCMDENATISNLTISGTNIKWYDEPTNGTILAETTLLQNNKTYYATQTLNDCESERLAVTVKIQDTQNPIANSPQTFCIQKNTKISDIVISGQNINWFESASSSIRLSETTLLENGITYYATQTINNCESERIPVAIIIQEATTADCINFVDELPYPKFFTPNGDGYNDAWTIDFAYLKPNTGIKIFDRYGKLLKELLPNSSWNGLFNNQELPATDYWFIATRANGQEYKGHFSLKR